MGVGKGQYTMRWDLKRDWIDALRSGEYKQVRGTFFDSRSNVYCCLGVERVVAVGEWDDRTPSNAGDMSSELENACIYLNDVQRRNFNYIADWIEDNVRAVL
jgi:hypothetical protein